MWRLSCASSSQDNSSIRNKTYAPPWRTASALNRCLKQINIYIYRYTFHHYIDVKWVPWHPHSPVSRLFVQQLKIKWKIKALHHWPFVMGIHRWPVDSPHKGPVMRAAFLLNDVTMLSWSAEWWVKSNYIFVVFTLFRIRRSFVQILFLSIIPFDPGFPTSDNCVNCVSNSLPFVTICHRSNLT